MFYIRSWQIIYYMSNYKRRIFNPSLQNKFYMRGKSTHLVYPIMRQIQAGKRGVFSIQMQKIVYRKYVTLNNQEAGFTLIEMLIALSIVLIICSLILHSMIVLQRYEREGNFIHPREWEIFYAQFKREITNSQRQEMSNGKLLLYQNSDVITIEKYQDKIRRRVNNQGHEVMLQKITGLEFIKNGRLIVIVVTDQNKRSFKGEVKPYVYE